MIITGLDLSLTSTGLAHLNTWASGWEAKCYRLRTDVNGRVASCPGPLQFPVSRLGTGPLNSKGDPDHLQLRISWMVREVRYACQATDLVAMEEPAYGAQGNAASRLVGLWWIVRHALWRDGRNVVVVNNTKVKMYATGKGSRVDKDEVMIATVRRYPMVSITNNDEADAFTLAAMASHASGRPLAVVPKEHERAIADWPYEETKSAQKRRAKAAVS